jgi:hypothetical protein
LEAKVIAALLLKGLKQGFQMPITAVRQALSAFLFTIQIVKILYQVYRGYFRTRA